MRSMGWLCAMLLGLGCGPGAESEPTSEVGSRNSEIGSRNSEAESEPESEAASEAEAEAEAEAEPETTPVDLTTVTELTVKILVAHDEHWVACGIIHSTGYVEVEVLGVGEPRPRLALFVSCPVDFGNRGLFSVGNTVRVTLHQRTQRWPTPPTELPPELPIRQVRSATDALGVVEPPR